jgi:hypothetical protein
LCSPLRPRLLDITPLRIVDNNGSAIGERFDRMADIARYNILQPNKQVAKVDTHGAPMSRLQLAVEWLHLPA